MTYSKIILKNDININIVTYKNLYANSYLNSEIWRWQDWLNRLQNPMTHSDKYKRGLVLYGDVEDETKDEKTIQKYRKDDNIINRSVITLDYDLITDFKGLYNAISNQLEGCSWIFHTTYSHTTDKPRIRLMVPIKELVSADDYRKYSRDLANHIGHEVDDASFIPSQAMALPVKPNKDTPFLFRYNDAPPLHINQIKAWIKDSADVQNKSTKCVNKRSGEYWKRIAFGVSEGGRNNALTSILGHLFIKGVNDHLIYGLAYNYGKMCQPPMTDKEINSTFQSIFKKHYKL
ncbi:primase alpha helix C-terminal domain-containing protein [Staphylococcus xylosus]